MPTPLFVIQAMAQVREGGNTNMLDRNAVEMLVKNQRAAEWISKASNSQYMDALNDMGAAESDNFWPETEAETESVPLTAMLEAEGRKLSGKYSWDGLSILRVCEAALTDANFHREAEVIARMIQVIETQDARPDYVLTVTNAPQSDGSTSQDFPGVEIDPISGLPEHLFRNDDGDE